MLSGWDRVRLRGMQRILANVGGMMSYLSHVGVWLKDFGATKRRGGSGGGNGGTFPRTGGRGIGRVGPSGRKITRARKKNRPGTSG